MDDCGIVYVATRTDKYIEEAFLSAESVKRRFPSLPITLFTDMAANPLSRAGACFDRVETVAGASGFSSNWAAGQLDRLRCLPLTPYQRTLHLDTDTRLQTDELPALFAVLDAADVAMVEAASDMSYSRKHYGRPLFHVGLILYRRDARILAWMKEWIACSDRNFTCSDQNPLPPVAVLDHVADEEVRRKLLRMDQISLVEMLSPEVNRFHLKVEKLDYSWNFTGSRLPENNRFPPRILHTSTLRKSTRRDILDVAHRWAIAGREAAAATLYDYAAAKFLAASPASRRPRRSSWLRRAPRLT